MFKFETRACVCGSEFEALDFWSEDATCNDCARREHQAMIDGFNAGKAYCIETIGGACPTQATGQWVDGRRFYFRARHGEWLLRVDSEDPVRGHVIAGGDDPSAGWMEPESVVSLLDEAASTTPATQQATP